MGLKDMFKCAKFFNNAHVGGVLAAESYVKEALN